MVLQSVATRGSFWRPYADLLRLPGVLSLFVLSSLARLPNAMSGVVVTLHVVQHEHLGYTQGGLVAAALALGAAIGGPWRGRKVDQQGLRTALIPSIVLESAVWFGAPHLRFWALLLAVFVAGVFLTPVFGVTRQALAVLVPQSQQRTAFALDSVAVEVTFMVGPLIGVWAATSELLGGTLGLSVLGAATLLAGLLLYVTNPPTTSSAPEEALAQVALAKGALPRRQLLAVLGAAFGAAVVLVGHDLGIVSTFTHAGRPEMTGWAVAAWSGGSMVGGLVYGARRWSLSPPWMVAGLAVLTVPAAVVPGAGWFVAAIVVAGLACAPTLASINAWLVAAVPQSRRGEAMGWAGTVSTVGNAAGAPLLGVVIDTHGPGAGLGTAAAVGALSAAVSALVLRSARRTPGR